MREFKLTSKIIWRKNSLSENLFYPSFLKEIKKREQFFNDNFEVKFVAADVDSLEKTFFPLYREEVMSRKDFTLDKNYIVNDLLNKVKNSNEYKLMLISHKNTLILAMLFSLKNDGLYIANRAFKKDFDKKLSHGATVSYWGEKLILDYGQKQNVNFFSRGKDTHPFVGRSRIGLPLFKIKTGMKPRKPFTEFSVTELEEKDIIEKNEPVLFFCNEDSEGFYKDVYLYYSAESIGEDYINEFKKVIDWSGLIFFPVKY